MTREQQYKDDQRLEAIASKFLDDNFYAVFKSRVPVARYSDTWHQYGGVDTSIGKLNIDEKFKIKGLMNQVLQYPSLEISFVNKGGIIQDGWFVNDNLSTDYYAYIGVSASVDNESELTSESQISAADILMFKKQEVIDLVEEETTMQQLKDDATDLRNEYRGYSNYKQRKTYPHRKFWLTFSKGMSERPINLVLPRKTLEGLPSTKHFIVYTNKKVRKA